MLWIIDVIQVVYQGATKSFEDKKGTKSYRSKPLRISSIYSACQHSLINVFAMCWAHVKLRKVGINNPRLAAAGSPMFYIG